MNFTEQKRDIMTALCVLPFVLGHRRREGRRCFRVNQTGRSSKCRLGAKSTKIFFSCSFMAEGVAMGTHLTPDAAGARHVGLSPWSLFLLGGTCGLLGRILVPRQKDEGHPEQHDRDVWHPLPDFLLEEHRPTQHRQ